MEVVFDSFLTSFFTSKQTKTMKNEELQKQENKNMKRICGWGKGKVRAERRTILRMFFKKKTHAGGNFL